MFDLDQKLQAWRDALPRSLAEKIERIDELESHLRDEVDRLTREGIAIEEAWTVAQNKLGLPGDLATEFSRNSFTWAGGWTLIALLLTGAFISVIQIQGRSDLLLAVHVITITAGYLGALAVGLLAMLAISWRTLGHWNSSHAQAFQRITAAIASRSLVITIVGFVLGSLWLVNWNGQFWNWNIKEVGGACVIGWLSVMRLCLRNRSDDAVPAMLAGIVGSLIVAFSWFGPFFFSRSAWMSGYGPLAAAVIVGHFALLHLCLLPPRWAALQLGRLRRAIP